MADEGKNPSLQDILDAAGAAMTALAVLFVGTHREVVNRIGRAIRNATGELAERIAVGYRNLVPLARKMVVRSFLVLLVLHIIFMAWVGGVFDGTTAPRMVSESFWFWWAAPVGLCFLGMVGLFFYTYGVEEITDRRWAGQLARTDRDRFRALYGPNRSPLFVIGGLFALVLGMSVADFCAYVNLANANGFYTLFVPAIFVALFALVVGTYAFLLVMVVLVPLGFVVERGGGFLARFANLIVQTAVAAALTGVKSENVKEKLGDLHVNMEGIGQTIRKATDLPVMGLAILAMFTMTIPSYVVLSFLLVAIVGSAYWNSQRVKKGIDTIEEERRNLNGMHAFWKWSLAVAIAFVALSAVFASGLSIFWQHMQCYSWGKLLSLAAIVGVAFAIFVYVAVKVRAQKMIAYPSIVIALVALGLLSMAMLTATLRTLDERPSWAASACVPVSTYVVAPPAPSVPRAREPSRRETVDETPSASSGYKRVARAQRPADCPPYLVTEMCLQGYR